MDTIIYNTEPQGSEGWLAARRGAITGSRFKDATDFKEPTKKDRDAGIRRGESTAKRLGYAMDLAREREGGSVLGPYINAEMRMGTEQEPFARMAYEDRYGVMVDEVGFAHTHDRRFGSSVDGLVGDDGMIEIKTMVSSATLFKAVVEGDISEYRQQCVGAMWLLRKKWCDLCLWAPDLRTRLHVIRIERDEDEIAALELDLLSFDKLVEEYRGKLAGKLGPVAVREAA